MTTTQDALEEAWIAYDDELARCAVKSLTRHISRDQQVVEDAVRVDHEARLAATVGPMRMTAEQEAAVRGELGGVARSELYNFVDFTVAEIDSLRARTAVLRDRLKCALGVDHPLFLTQLIGFVEHKFSCNTRGGDKKLNGGCTCGLDELVRDVLETVRKSE